ncbi:hypothetical protein TTHERM_001395378 (macronuclear) [Tetrahymena thermophila SB210]|uniref:Transmembrane protein n=1 Tax=Tetrahymena thermophila (strain SB210) TaxID=312017 RepID=W7XH16_TETTS|nr:hypothetical protein TTHERM_001395378 [Tetrahymena thermophila SB210]EWS76403.1 hypothetical protein TTHERM_001395378 [Tetrahymena thermophila SB210]|eukprot:XP_012651061.1 hypothetical protein TTHERM_001395378 [Tetrahymena thermophila SB210]
MIIKSAILKSYIVFLVIKLSVEAQNQCAEGCQTCLNSNNQNTCTKCLEGFELDLKNNLCIYTKCSNNLFFDQRQNNSNILDSRCVAICSAFSYRNQQSNLCQSKLKCSIQKKTQQYLKDNTSTKDFFIYQDNYYIIQKEDQLSMYNRNDLNLIKNMKLQARDLQVFNVNSSIFVIGSDNLISIWDIKNGSRISKTFINMISVNSLTKMDSIDNRYVLAINIYTEKESEFQIFYDLAHQSFALSNSIKINTTVLQDNCIQQ